MASLTGLMVVMSAGDTDVGHLAGELRCEAVWLWVSAYSCKLPVVEYFMNCTMDTAGTALVHSAQAVNLQTGLRGWDTSKVLTAVITHHVMYPPVTACSPHTHLCTRPHCLFLWVVDILIVARSLDTTNTSGTKRSTLCSPMHAHSAMLHTAYSHSPCPTFHANSRVEVTTGFTYEACIEVY